MPNYRLTYDQLGEDVKFATFDHFPSSIEIGKVSNTMVGESIIRSLAQKGFAVGFSGKYILEEIKEPTAFDTFFDIDMDETDPKAMCAKTWHRQQSIIDDQQRQINLLKGWEKIAHVNGESKRKLIDKIDNIGKALIEEGRTKQYRIDKALEIINNEL